MEGLKILTRKEAAAAAAAVASQGVAEKRKKVLKTLR